MPGEFAFAVGSRVEGPRATSRTRPLEELDNAAAAAVIGIAPAAASKRYLRALARLKDALASARLRSAGS
jgi:hypothetical protein